jgi:hypothetical protein
MRNRRRIVTRYDRLTSNYVAGIALTAVTTEWSE